MGVIRQEPVIGYLDNNRTFYVNLLTDYTFSFTWMNGDNLTEKQKSDYCVQIASAQNKLENVYGFILRGRGYSQYGFWYGYWSKDNQAGVSATTQKYYTCGKVDNQTNKQNCVIKTKAEIDT
jgi:hypothetical protein